MNTHETNDAQVKPDGAAMRELTAVRAAGAEATCIECEGNGTITHNDDDGVEHVLDCPVCLGAGVTKAAKSTP